MIDYINFWQSRKKDPLWVISDSVEDDAPYNPPVHGRYRIIMVFQYSIGDTGDYGLEEPREFWAYFRDGYWFRNKADWEEWRENEPQYMPEHYALEYEGGICGWKHNRRSLRRSENNNLHL